MNTCEIVEFNWATSAPDFASSDLIICPYIVLSCLFLFSFCMSFGVQLPRMTHLRNEQSKNLQAVWDLVVLKERHSKVRQIHRLSWYGFKKTHSGNNVVYTNLTEINTYGESTVKIEGEITVSRWNVSSA